MDTVLLLHAGVADRGMWSPQADALEGAGYRVIAPDLRGFGERRLDPVAFSHHRDAESVINGPAAVVGASLGGRVALELAVHRPDLVEALVVIAPGLPGWEWSEEIQAGWAAEEEAFGRGDFEAAAEIGVRMWVDGPSRSPSEVDQGVREAVREMLLRSYAMQEGAWEAGAREELLEPSVADRLAEIRCPTLVLVGGDDLPEMKAIATRVAEAVSSARVEIVEHTAHLPSVESPDEVTALVLGFLDGRP